MYGLCREFQFVGFGCKFLCWKDSLSGFVVLFILEDLDVVLKLCVFFNYLSMCDIAAELMK